MQVSRWGVAALAALGVAVPLAAATPTLHHVAGWPVGASQTNFKRQEVTGVDTDGDRLYLCRASRPPVLVFDLEGRFLASWGAPHLGEPHSIRVDPRGNLWVPDIETQQVYRFSPSGTLLGAMGIRKRRGATPDRFNRPTDVAFGRNGEVYIADGYGNSRIVVATLDGEYVGEWGSRGSGPGQFRLPHSITTDPEGLVYVADRENRRIQVFLPDGTYVREWPTAEKPFGLEITPDGRMFVASAYSYSVELCDLFGGAIARWGQRVRGRPIGALCEPHMVCVDRHGALYTAELAGHRVQKFLVQ